jgi:serine/alanine adding enzyme
MAGYKALTLDDAEAWKRWLPADRSVFGSLEFAQIMAQSPSCDPRLFVFSDETCRIAYPFVVRPVAHIPDLDTATGEWFDITSPDYTGPIVVEGTAPTDPTAFQRSFHEYCVGEGIVAEFARLHPWLASYQQLDADQVSVNRDIVYIDLTQSLEELWSKSLSDRCRKSVRKAERSGIRIIRDNSFRAIEEFFRIYVETMHRRHAAERYNFPLSYFQSFGTTLDVNSEFVLAMHEDQVVAASLYLFDKDDLYAYLGGLDVVYQDLRPRNSLTYEMAVWGKSQGMKRLILGGGYTPDDGIFKHKASYSPLRAKFSVYKQVHLPEVYSYLCECNDIPRSITEDRSGFFPAYRSSEVELQKASGIYKASSDINDRHR